MQDIKNSKLKINKPFFVNLETIIKYFRVFQEFRYKNITQKLKQWHTRKLFTLKREE